MLGALGSFLLSNLMFSNIEGFSKAFIKGGEYVPNTVGFNTVSKKILGTGFDEMIEQKGLKFAFKGLAKKGIGSSLLYGAGNAAFNWFFNPYLTPVKIALESVRDGMKNENDINKKRSLGITADETSLYQVDQRFNALKGNLLQSSSVQEQQVTQLLNTPNLSSSIMNNVLGKL